MTTPKQLSSQGLVTTSWVAEGPAPKVVEQAIRDHQARAVVMATHGHSGATRLLMGSVAEAILHLAQVPVLLVRPTAAKRVAAQGEGRRIA